jgi:ribosomal-protein-alanine N-acetyltransferase
VCETPLAVLLVRLIVTGSYRIRAANPDDAAALAAIDASVSCSPRSERQFVAACNPQVDHREIALIVERDDQICGYVLFAQVLDEASVYSIAVAKECQREGLGKMLQQSGASRCLLEVRHSNAAARGLYERSGFQLDGIRKNYYPAHAGREDALLMSKELKG